MSEMKKSTVKRKLAWVAGIVGVIVVVCVIWFTRARLRDLDDQLAASEERAAAIYENLRSHARELNLALEKAESARRLAADAEQEANREMAARQEADSLRERAEQEADQEMAARREADSLRELAEQQTRQARVETRQMSEELGRILRNRDDELNRMQQALNMIAPTNRTPSGMVMMLSNEAFQFEFDKASLQPGNRETLSRIAGILLASHGYRLFIDGHTDDIGTDEYNLGLSERRAQSVRDYLVSAGVPSEVISMQGFGKSEPLSNEKTNAARARNRRVEIGIVDTIIHYDGKETSN